MTTDAPRSSRTTPPLRHALPFLKGHGTENDFVILPDPAGRLELTAADVALLCDRRAGLGADGVLRVVRADSGPAEWFMDYRNADGSIAEMCGNGVRVFAQYLRRAGLAKEDELPVATRAGLRVVTFEPDGRLTVAMGSAALPSGPGESVTVTAAGRSWPARHVDMGNPHAVAFVDDLAEPGALLDPPGVAPAEAYPHGTNVEFVTDRGPGHLALRVHERGSGETRSCGTGACAAMVAAARRDGLDPAAEGRAATYTVDVPGGRLTVTERADGTVTLTGPAVILAEGTIDPALWETARHLAG
ncbi:diaminopimelate epimerase [Streptomyces sp. DSM 44917]|uniref:Diaminopimelate epimerase n=1 Tax=Streptomyces boetiae TaxID=3075541 RepID=A0ABU2L2M2_9ACTN|nr:diaminopimelate epimerase [Streptomyces sp. DSM 44917]MDT0305617.1 diaminopimelate epimerase [Streptomyces sp. DSM 44917]